MHRRQQLDTPESRKSLARFPAKRFESMDSDGLPPDGGDGDSPDRDHPDEEERIFAVAGRDIRVSLTPYSWMGPGQSPGGGPGGFAPYAPG